jgi:hypothetical protein
VAHLHRRDVNSTRCDVYILTSLIVGSLTSIADGLLYSAASPLRLGYNLACFLLWSLDYPLIDGGRAFAVAVPALFLLCTAGLLVNPSERKPLEKGSNPLTEGSFISCLTLDWLTPLLQTSARRAITTNDTWPVGPNLSVRHALREDGIPGKQPIQSLGVDEGLLRFIARISPGPLAMSTLLSLGDIALTLLAPFILRNLLENRRFTSITALVSASILQAVFSAHSILQMRRVAIQLRSGLTALICDKVMDVPALRGSQTVEPSVLIEVDVLSIFYFIEKMNNLWLIPIQIIVRAGALMYILNWQSVIAAGVATVRSPPTPHTRLFRYFNSCT